MSTKPDWSCILSRNLFRVRVRVRVRVMVRVRVRVRVRIRARARVRVRVRVRVRANQAKKSPPSMLAKSDAVRIRLEAPAKTTHLPRNTSSSLGVPPAPG